VSNSSDKGLISRIYKELKKLNSKRTNNPINKQANELNRQLSKEEQMANKYIRDVHQSQP
jgi:paraquat-inducible protein B